MNPVWVVAIPLVLLILGMILNALNLRFEEPSAPAEQDPVKRLAAEKESFRQLFYKQRERAQKRQQRVGQFGWLMLVVTVGSFIWFYVDIVKTTTQSNRIAALQTLNTDEGQQTVLSVTLRDGDNAKYVIKPDKSVDTAKVDAAEKEKVSSYELDDMATALNENGSSLPSGLYLKIAKSH
jgi:hypothetical protein